MPDKTEWFYKIVLPTLTLVIGVLIPSWWNSRTLSVQELGMALQIKGAPTPTKDAVEWADRTIATYTKMEKPMHAPQTSVPPATPDGLYKNTCLVPPDAIKERPAFYIDEQGERLVGQDARIVLARTIADYRTLAGRYDLLIEILHKTCGYLDRKP